MCSKPFARHYFYIGTGKNAYTMNFRDHCKLVLAHHKLAMIRYSGASCVGESAISVFHDKNRYKSDQSESDMKQKSSPMMRQIKRRRQEEYINDQYVYVRLNI